MTPKLVIAALGCCVSLACLARAAGAEPATAQRPSRRAKFILGVGTHFGGSRFSPATLDMLQQSGIVSVRDEIGWIGVERKKGEMNVPAGAEHYFQSVLAAGIDPLLILDYGNPFYDNNDGPTSDEGRAAFVRYARFMVNHFRGKLYLYEFWNEWDIAIGGTTAGTADDYVALLKLVYPAVKESDPDAMLMAGAVTPMAIRNGWLERMLQLGALDFCDAVSIHTYIYGARGEKGSPEYWASWMQQVQEMLHRYSGGKDVPLYVTEHGWPTQVDERGRTPEESARYLARLYLLARTMPWMKGIWWYDFQDDGWKWDYNENNFGIVRPDLTPKPAWHAMRSIADVVKHGEYLGRVDVGDPYIWILKFRMPDGRDVWAIWSAHPDDGWQVTLEAPKDARYRLTLCEVGSQPFARSWGDNNWYEGKRAHNEGQIKLTVRGMPWLVEGRLDGVRAAGVTRREFPERKR